MGFQNASKSAMYSDAQVDPDNPPMLLSHLLCAAAEAPLRTDELALSPGAMNGQAVCLVDDLSGLNDVSNLELWCQRPSNTS